MNPLIAMMIRHSGRSWWQARYSDGRVLSEWDTLAEVKLLPIGRSSSSRWEDIPKKGMIGLRLLCPNGLVGELQSPEGHRFFQFKIGGVCIPVGSPGGGDISRFCDAHVIGVVVDDKGNCLCRAWETKEKRLIEFRDNILNMKYRNIGALAIDVQGLKV